VATHAGKWKRLEAKALKGTGETLYPRIKPVPEGEKVMNTWHYKTARGSAIALALATAFAVPALLAAKPGSETAGNNLSFPVIWSDGITKTLPGTAGFVPSLAGEWWYWWGTEGADPDIVPLSCAPDPDDETKCDDGIPLQANGDDVPFDDPDLVKAYLQKDFENVWQAASALAENNDSEQYELEVHRIDWGDNLESVDWYTRSKVRTEVVLFQDVDPMLEYEMRHVSGWGIDEVHGLAVDSLGPMLGAGTQATVYTHCARLTIQKLLVDRGTPALADLEWVPGEGWTEPEGYPVDLINPHIFNGSVHEGGDGPGYYSAEINVKGRIIFGYTWNVRKLNEGPGDYRITFSLDNVCGSVQRNTYFGASTEIIRPSEEELEAAALVAALEDHSQAIALLSSAPESSDEGGGAWPELVADEDLTYIDVRILEKGGGGGGGHGGGGGGSGGGGGHGRR